MSDGKFTNPFDNAAAGSGFEVYPQALCAATDDVFAARDKGLKFGQEDLAEVVLRDDDVGMLGARAQAVNSATFDIRIYR